MDLVWVLLAIAVMAALAWVGYRIEPHWVARDGRRFLCNAQLLDDKGNALGRWQETRINVMDNGDLVVDQKKHMRRRVSTWRMAAESPEPPRRRVVFLLRGRDSFDRPALLAVRLPSNSIAVALLRPLVGGRRESSASDPV